MFFRLSRWTRWFGRRFGWHHDTVAATVVQLGYQRRGRHGRHHEPVGGGRRAWRAGRLFRIAVAVAVTEGNVRPFRTSDIMFLLRTTERRKKQKHNSQHRPPTSHILPCTAFDNYCQELKPTLKPRAARKRSFVP